MEVVQFVDDVVIFVTKLFCAVVSHTVWASHVCHDIDE